jgi:Fe-S-cluster containining protein
MTQQKNQLPVIAECAGCGVCCFHMGYPPYIRPDGEKEGEVWWYRLPEELKKELEAYIASYPLPEYGADVESFDGPCCWFDMETRQCSHHEHRPNVCRDFETGSPQCHEWRGYYQEKIVKKFPLF